MGEGDEVARTLFLAAAGVLIVAYLIGGFLTQAAGTWRDHGKQVVLRQLGPIIWGEAHWAGGRQLYRGRAFWGTLQLLRWDFGAQHLRDLGFSAEQVPLLEGKVTGELTLRLQADKLSGTFTGRKFSFDGQRLQRISSVAPVPRTWTREPV